MPDGTPVSFPDDMPKEQIRGLIASKYPDAVKQIVPKMAEPSVGRTVVDQALQGVPLVGTFMDEAAGTLGGLGAKAYDKITGQHLFDNQGAGDMVNQGIDNAQQNVKNELQQRPGLSIGSQLISGLATGGVAAGTNAGQAITSALGSGSLPARFAKGLAAGATSGAAYGAGAGTDGNRLQEAGQNALYGGAIGGALPVAGATLSAVKNSILPSANEILKPLAQKALDYGIPLSRTQVGESSAAKTIASATGKLPLSGAAGFQRTQQDAFNSAISKTIGEDVNRITPEVIDNAFNNIGDKFDSVLAGRTISIGKDTMDRLVSIAENASNSITGDNVKIVQNNIKKFLNDVSTDGTISGEKIGSFRSSLTSTLKNVRNDASPFLHDLQDVVVDASVDGVPEAKRTLNEARLQYKNLKTIQPLADKAVNGDISPALLLGRVRQSFGNTFSRGGGGDLGNLARIGTAFLKDPIPDSGTAQRTMVYKALEGLSAGGAGFALGGLPGAVATAGIPIATARLLNTINTAQPLVRMAIKPGQLPSLTSGLLQGNLSGEAAGLLNQ